MLTPVLSVYFGGEISTPKRLAESYGEGHENRGSQRQGHPENAPEPGVDGVETERPL